MDVTQDPAIPLIISIVLVLVLEVVGVVRTRQGRIDTISELWWWITERTSRPGRWALNGLLVAGMAWATVHLVCNCGV